MRPRARCRFLSAPRYVLECAFTQSDATRNRESITAAADKVNIDRADKARIRAKSSAAMTEELTNTVRETKESAERKKSHLKKKRKKNNKRQSMMKSLSR